MKKKFYGYLIALVFVMSSVLALNGMQNTSSAATQDCSANSIMTCGASSTTDFVNKYQQNAQGDFAAIYAHFGLAPDELSRFQQTAVLGTAYKNGEIRVDGKVVATNASSLGRQNKSGDYPVNIGGKTYYQGSNQTAFNSDSLPVIVLMNNGQFEFAVIMACGNPMTGTPTPPPPPPPPPAPVYKCDSLKATKISRAVYRFTAAASATNATLTGYRVNFGDGTNGTFTAAQSTFNHTYAAPGSYTAVLTAVFNVGGMEKTATSNACKATIKIDKPEVNKVERCDVTTRKIVTITEEQAKDTDRYAPVGSERCEVCPYNPDLPKDSEECVPPVAPPVEPPVETPPQVLPATGPAELAIAGIGLSSLSAAGYYWQASRRQLINKLLGR